MALSRASQVMVAAAAVFVVSWAVGAALQLDEMVWPLTAAFLAFFGALAVRLLEAERVWVRILGGLVIVALIVGVLLLILTIWYGSQICDSCD